MASILQILRRIGGAKAAPTTGKAGELAIWKAGPAADDDTVLYVHDGTQYVPIIDNDANLTLVKPGAGVVGRMPIANAAGTVVWSVPTGYAAASVTITGSTSISGGGDLSVNRTLSLVGDAASPGNGYYYGTNAAGVKGFYALPSGGSGTVTQVIAGTGLTGGTISTTGTIALAASGATAGTYRSVTVDAYGRVTGGTNPTTLAGYGITDALSTARRVSTGTGLQGGGDLSADRTLSLANTGVTAGAYQGLTIDAQGRVTAAVDKGFVVGPASATDNSVARYDLATGKLIQDSTVTIDDAGNMAGVHNLTATGGVTFGTGPANIMMFKSSVLFIPNGLNIDSGTLAIGAGSHHVGFGVSSPLARVDVNGSAVNNVVTMADGVMDLSKGQMFVRTTTSNTTFSFTNVPAARGVTVVLHLTEGGGFTNSWPTSVKWPGGTAPSLSAAGIDVLVFTTHDGGTTWRGNIFGKDMK